MFYVQVLSAELGYERTPAFRPVPQGAPIVAKNLNGAMKAFLTTPQVPAARHIGLCWLRMWLCDGPHSEQHLQPVCSSTQLAHEGWWLHATIWKAPHCCHTPGEQAMAGCRHVFTQLEDGFVGVQVLIAILARTFLHIIYEFSSYLGIFSTQALNMSGGMGAQVTPASKQSNSGQRGLALQPFPPFPVRHPLAWCRRWTEGPLLLDKAKLASCP